jgi:hypothetical protein
MNATQSRQHGLALKDHCPLVPRQHFNLANGVGPIRVVGVSIRPIASEQRGCGADSGIVRCRVIGNDAVQRLEGVALHLFGRSGSYGLGHGGTPQK